jgi:two-component system response regulator FixJ
MERPRALGTLGHNIYVVDDDRMVRRSLSFALSTAGFSVHPFASGSDFIEEIAALAAGCVLLDIRMPGMDGFKVIEMLKPRREIFPVVVITGHGDVETAVKAMKCGASDFLEKPFDDAALLRIIENVFAALSPHFEEKSVRLEAERDLGVLTPREYEVVRGLVAGLPNKVIAHRLSLSVRTIEMHRTNLMIRLGAKSLADLLRLALKADVSPLN